MVVLLFRQFVIIGSYNLSDRPLTNGTYDNPKVVQHQDLSTVPGVTGGDVKKRIANAKKDPTYLLAEVEVVTTFKLANINRKGLEALLHKFFDGARLNVGLQDRFGIPAKPREWFLLPLGAIEEAIEKIKEGTLDQFQYDPESAKLVRSPVSRK